MDVTQPAVGGGRLGHGLPQQRAAALALAVDPRVGLRARERIPVILQVHQLVFFSVQATQFGSSTVSCRCFWTLCRSERSFPMFSSFL